MFFLMIIGLAVLVLVFLAALWAGKESDAAALDRQRQLVTARLKDQVERVSHEIQLMSAGYGSLLQTDRPTAANRALIESKPIEGGTSAEMFGKIATTIFGYNGAFLVTAEGNLAFDTDAEAVRRFKWVRPLLQPMIHQLQADYKKGGSLHAKNRNRVELLRLEGRPSIAGVAMVSSPGDGESKKKPAEELYLVAFRFIDGAALDALSREQGLNGARYARTADQEHNEVAFQIEATGTDEPIGFIVWTPDLPGSRVVGRLAPVLSVVGIVIAGLFIKLMTRLRRSLRELSASENHARHLSLHDVLTGLPNRALFAARLQHEIWTTQNSGVNAALAVIDLDHFKEVNDAFGHPAGDELLRSAVDRIKTLIKRSDTLARIGGDEFILLFMGSPEVVSDALDACRAIVSALSKPFYLQHGDAQVRIGCSIGFTTFGQLSLSANEILRRADVALYEAKAKGRGQMIEYDPGLDQRVEMREALKIDLRKLLALHQGGLDAFDAEVAQQGQLEVFFQGVHRANVAEELSGAEALIRWRHPIYGLLSPDRFIPLAEEIGLIDQLGLWVLRRAVAAASVWPPHISVAVNVSASQIRSPDFARQVLSILTEGGLTPSRLELELTEAALFELDGQPRTQIASLRSHGIRIALDDFGTGFSSLSHLVQINIDRIKIDRSFVQLLGTRAEGAAIVSAIIALSKSLGKATTAEGVETENQREFLTAAGCTDLQGFLLSRPVPEPTFSSGLQSVSQTKMRRTQLAD
jgi:diguanylate cyclase (GGDEF)-like protein